MNFEQLLYAEVLAQHRSMQKAADVLHISKSGLSTAIAQLESELGVEIFDKSSSGTVLTDDGRQLLASISDILRYKNGLEKAAAKIANPSQHQKFTIHYMNTMLRPFINSFVENYDKKYRPIQLNISCHEFETIVSQVRDQAIEAGFIAINNSKNDAIKHLNFTPICDSKLVLLCGPENDLAHLERPITLEDLKNQHFSIFNDQFHDDIFERLQFQCGPLDLVLRVDDAWAMEQAILRLNTVCFGRTLQSQLASHTDFSKLVAVDIGHLIDENFKLGWLTNPNTMLSPTMTLILEDMSAQIKRDAQSIGIPH
ncbi:LysR family transcriptional regulator [Aerococcus agrisoli]|uniref:LysR family transcriptional regulator n=1 Tax=Aerococcus agrisoli TaxID=2487350 RepID=A0A3N4GDV8_9LACT|nr:LysR family transcriptional regulator [Aerococcus agrisoli]RPA60969.1 LysR family transcriptional regulator [Aerococcus agrisoli]